MQIIPVLDLLDGQVVRGVAGRRETYAPIESRLVRSSAPLDVARSLRDTFGLKRLYVADLDAILHERPHWTVIERLVSEDFELMVDAGIRGPELCRQLVERGVSQVITGLETLPGIDQLRDITSEVGSESLVFSLDMMQGEAFGCRDGWHGVTPLMIADQVFALGLHSMIVLDLSGVGVGQGVSTLALCRQLIERHSGLRIITGGGVRDVGDIREAATIGLDGLLVASALHDGSITAEALSGFTMTGGYSSQSSDSQSRQESV